MQDKEFLKEITSLPGGSGDEGLIRDLLKKEISKVTDPIIDNYGNIYGKVGNGPTVIAMGHMDEIGFMVREISNDGLIKLGMVGFVFPFGMTCQIFSVVTDNGLIDGVIGLNPNQGSSGGRKEFPSVEEITLDIGCSSKDEVISLGVEVGNAVIAKSHFTELKNNQLLAKAWDNRIGCAISVRAMQQVKDLKVTFIGGGSVQEEVGCRGAKALGVSLKPDIAFSLDTAPASNEEGSIVGKGPQLFVMDSSTIANKKLLKFVKKVANDNNIPYQVSLLRRGGTDTSELQNVGGGCPALAIGIPVKYIHTPTSVISYDDYENAVKLMVKVLEALNEETVNELKKY